MPFWHLLGDYLFVHAGVRAGLPIERQSPEDLLWLRYSPFDLDEPFPQVVVHGHTPLTQPFVGLNRINVDTGAYASNRLTCVILDATSKRIIQT
jgi:serine/threonine protein phosphatase 1